MRRRVEAVGGLDVQLAVVVQEHDQAADGAVMLGQDLEHPVQRRAKVERARERVADLEQRRQPPRLPGLDGGRIVRADRVLAILGVSRRRSTSSSVIVTGRRNGIMPRSSAPTFSIWCDRSRLARRLRSHLRPVGVLVDPVCGELAAADLVEHLLHLGLGLRGDDARPAV